jgi:hypothetical protein
MVLKINPDSASPTRSGSPRLGLLFMFDDVQVRVWSSRGAGGALPHILRQANRRGDPPCLPGQVQDPYIRQQFGAMLGIRDFLMRIWIRGSAPLTNGSGSNSGSDTFLQRLLGCKNIIFSSIFFIITYPQAHFVLKCFFASIISEKGKDPGPDPDPYL